MCTIKLSTLVESCLLTYSDDWLKQKPAHVLDPSLQLYRGLQYAPQSQQNFSLFLDSSPDRWGRFLMDRREALTAREEGRKEQRLMESDYLLGVHDLQRMGALRFRTCSDRPFLEHNKARAAPPWASLRELEHASLELEKVDSEQNPNYSKWLHMLLTPGSSLGGARPKASIMDEKEQLWIAKFPNGAESTRDLEQLWRRIVFFICVSNVDDHLRNHGFILHSTGWVLSPAFDINPVASGNGLKLNISESDNSQDLNLAKDVAVYFRLKQDRAKRIIQEIIQAVKTWRKEATSLGISSKEQARISRAFRVADEQAS